MSDLKPNLRRPADAGIPGELLLTQPLIHQLVGYHCRRAFLHVQPFGHQKMAALDLRPSDFAVLSLLRVNPGISQKQVAQGVGVAPPNLAPVIERMESRRLIARRRSSQDGRVQSFSLTPQGERLCRKAEAIALEFEEAAAQHLSDTERQTLVQLLCKLYGPTESGDTS